MESYKQKGFTLIELLVVFLVLCFGLLALAKFNKVLLEGSSLAKQRTEALYYAQKKMETLRSYSVLNTTTGLSAYQDIVSGSDTVTGVNATYSRAWTVTSNTSPDYKVVNLTVSWTSQGNTAESVVLSSMISKTDPLISGTIINKPSIGVTP